MAARARVLRGIITFPLPPPRSAVVGELQRPSLLPMFANQTTRMRLAMLSNELSIFVSFVVDSRNAQGPD
jgi:hypothetical protein